MILLECVISYRDFEIYTPDNCLHPGQLFTPRATVYTPDNCLHPGQLFTPRATVYTPDNCLHLGQLFTPRTTVYTPDNCLHPGQLFTPRKTVYTPDNCLHPGQLCTPRTTVYTPDNCYVVSKINVAVSFDVGHVLAVRRIVLKLPGVRYERFVLMQVALTTCIRDGVTEDPEAWFRFVVYDLS